MRSVPVIDGAEFLGHMEPDEFLMRIARSRGYAAGAEGQAPNPAYPRDSAAYAAYMSAWERARSINETRPVVPKSSLPRPCPAPLPADIDDFQLMKEPADVNEAVSREGNVDRHYTDTLDRDRSGAGGTNRSNSGSDREPDIAGKISDRKLTGPAKVPQQNVHQKPLVDCGLVVVVDFLNVLVRSFHASPLSRINGVRVMLDTLAGVIDRLSPEFLVFALDGGYDHRKQLYPDYKAHRGEKPPGLAEQMQLGEEVLDMLGWPAIRVLGWEADDVIASLATQLDQVATGVIVISSDKDLTQLLATTAARISEPWGKGSFTTEATCREKFGVSSKQLGDYLALVGDASDGVPGVKGVGPKKAAELLTFYGTLDKVLEAARCLMIPGAAGKNLREQTDVARLSRELVALRADLPVGQHWHEWPLCEPRAGWQERLREAGLFGPAQRLKQCLIKIQAGQGKPKDLVEFASDDPSVLEIEWCEMDAPLAPPEVMQSVFGTASPKPAVSPGAPAASPVPPVEDPYESNLACARRVYDRAQEAKRQHGKACASGYYPGTLMRVAWEAGSNDQPFESIDVRPFDHHGKPLAAQPAVTSKLF